MKRNFWLRKLPLALIAGGLVITAAAWQGGPVNPTHTANDTIPKNKKIHDIDDALLELEKARLELERTFKDKNWEKEMQEAMKGLDAAKIRADIEKAMKEVDAAKIQADVQKAISEIDFEKMKKELQASLREMDADKIKAEIEKALKEVDAAKIQADVQASISKIDMEKMKLELEKVKELDFSKMEEELKQIQPQIEKSMADARESIEKAKKELSEYKTFIDGLAADGLIDKKQSYTIEYKKGELSINGKKQSDAVLKKYQQFLKDRRDFTIKKNEEDFNIDND